MKKEKINIYTGNHNKEYLIEDAIRIIKETFNKNFDVSVSKDKILVNGNNIFIEFFYKKNHVKNIQKIKKKFPNTKFIIFLTEFFPTKKFSQCCNDFDSSYLLIIVTKILLLLESIILYLSNGIDFLKRVRSSILFFEKKNYVDIKIKQSKIKSYKTIKILKTILSFFNIHKFFQKTHFLEANIKRYLYTKKIIDKFDCLLTIHPKITNLTKKFYGKDSLTLFPKVNAKKLFSNNLNNKTIISTGLKTDFREKYIKKINELLFDSKYSIQVVSFQTKEFLKNYNLNYNVHHNEAWPNSSAVRIVRAIWNNHIPIVSRKFKDHIIEDLCLELNEYNFKDIDNLIIDYKKKISKKIINYNTLVDENNQPFIDEIFNNKHDETKQQFLNFYINNHLCFNSKDLYFNSYFQGYSIFETKHEREENSQESKYFAFKKKIKTKVISIEEYKKFLIFESQFLNLIKVKIYEDQILKSKKNNVIVYKNEFLSVILFDDFFYVIKNNIKNFQLQLNSIAKFSNLFQAINYIIKFVEMKSNKMFEIRL